MHELSIAATLMEQVLEFAATHDAGKVLRVRLAVGELTCIQPDQLKFCYESITTETAVAGSALEIEAVPARVRCPDCAYEGPPKYWSEPPMPTLQCPACGRTAEASQGHECAIKSIQYASACPT